MRIRSGRLPHYNRDSRLLIVTTGISAVSFFGIQMLLKVLYVLRLGYGPEYVGLYSASSALVYMAMGLPSGMLGRRFGTRKSMLLGGLGATAGMALLPLTESAPGWARDLWPILSQIVLTVGWSLYNVNLVPALMAATTAQNRNSAYAVSNAVRSLGMFLGTLVGGALPGLFGGLMGHTLDEPDPYRYALWVGAALSIFALLPVVLAGEATPVSRRTRARVMEPFPALPVALVASYVYLRHAGWATCQAFCNVYMDAALQLSTSSIGLLTGAGQFLAMIASLLTPRLVARHSHGWTLAVTTLGVGVSLLPLALVPHWTAAGVGRLGILVLSAVWMPALQVFQMELVPGEWQSVAYGLVSTAMGLGFGSTSLAGGYIIASAGYRTLFLIGALLCAIASVVMWAIGRRQHVAGATHPPAQRPADSRSGSP
ncbi:MAG: MFS transporter [Anaerolineae bacterium]|nr:MFS transporter [Anaerolineae bacterium]